MWVKLDDDFPDHPKVVALDPVARWLFVAGLCYANRFLTDGFIPDRQIGPLLNSRNGKTTNFRSQLIEAGLWERTEVNGVQGYAIHDFLHYQPSRKQVIRARKKAAKRIAKWRKKKR